MSGAESPDRLDPDHKVTVEDVRELMGPSTPHFALQLRDRIAREGQSSGHVQEHELPLPSLRLERPGGAG